ncbi:MAG: LysM peptidoglycan-binding domain-containing protein [Firmicutes bacterium]|nr:LysM peptidoglycan-binding domain-containing protein [Bacillota bacterium]
MYDKYLIRYGDTLSSIASKFNTKESTIMELNNIPFPDMIREGKEIIVPIKKEKYFEYYTIEKGDNLYSIARRYNINPDLLAILNGLNSDDYIYPNQQILIPKSNYSYYVTKDGDTLDIVSKRFNISSKELIDNNDIIYLLEGQLLVKKN